MMVNGAEEMRRQMVTQQVRVARVVFGQSPAATNIFFLAADLGDSFSSLPTRVRKSAAIGLSWSRKVQVLCFHGEFVEQRLSAHGARHVSQKRVPVGLGQSLVLKVVCSVNGLNISSTE